MKKTSTVGKRLLALLLTAVMMLGVCAAALPGLVLRAHAASSKAASVTCGDLTFVVPEAIYLYPDALSSVIATSTPFQFYVNNNSDGTVKAGNATSETTGYIYYSYSGAASATISYLFYDEALSSALSGTANLSSSTITSGSSVSITGGQSPSLANNVNGCYIEWSLSFSDSTDGKTKTAYAYTYVYKPYTVPVACSVTAGCSKNAAYYKRWAGNVTWISGFNDIVQGSNIADDDWDGDYFYYTKFSNFSAFISQGDKAYVGGTEVTGSRAKITSGFSVAPSSSGGTLGYVVFSTGSTYSGNTIKLNTSPSNCNTQEWGQSSAGTYTSSVKNLMATYYSKTGAPKLSGNLYCDSYGRVTIDTSRYSNLNQIPNLAVGMEVYNDENSPSNSGNWYVADYTDCSLDGYTTWHSDGTGYYATKNYVIASQGTAWNSKGYDESEGVRYCGAWPRTLLGNTTTQGASKMYMVKGTYINVGDQNPQTYAVCKLQATYYNKANLRSAVNNATKAMAKLGVNGKSGAGTPTSCYFDANTSYKWTAFQTAYKNAVIALTKLNSTSNPDTLATNLNNALANLCTKISFNANGGTLSSTNDVYVQIGTNQSVDYTPTYTATAAPVGYAFDGWSTNASATTGSATVTVGYNNTLYAVWTPIQYTVSFDGNGATSGSMSDQTFTYGQSKNLTDNAFTKSSYQVTYNLNNGTMTGSNPVTVQDTFAGWKGSQRLISDATEYSFDNTSSAATPYKDVKQWTINAPFAANEVYHLEFDAKGSGSMINYFYGASGYWNVATSVSGAGATNHGSDGNITHTLTSSYSHYTVTWTLASSGNANVDKYVLFRVMPGNSLTFKNVVFWKETGAATYSNQQSVSNLCTTAGAVYQMRAQWTPGSVTLPTPTREGYTFGGWYTDSALTTSAGAAGASYTPTANITLYAKWTAIDYTLTYALATGSTLPTGASLPAAVTGKHIGDTVTLTQPAPVDGYTFDGWKQDGTTVTSVTFGAGNITVTGSWTVNQYTITFDSAGGSAVASITQAYGSAITAPQAPTRAGYVFAGWQPQLPSTMPLGGLAVVAQWTKVAVDDQYVLDYGLPVDLAVLNNDIPDATLKSVTASGDNFTATKNQNSDTITFTPTAALNAPVTFTYTVTYSGTDYTASVTVIPANSVYYEETFFTFQNGTDTTNKLDATWVAVGSGSAYANAFQNGARPGDANSPVYGFDSTYDNKNAMTYSLGTAQYAAVSASHKGGATASFTFTGTGFDFYALTDHESGLAFVDVYKNVNGSWQNVESTMVNVYFGYKYGRLYLDANDKVTLTETDTPIYYAAQGDTGSDTFFINGTTRGTRTNTGNPAYGWVAGENTGGVSGVYQVPVISWTGHDYATYKVVVEPRWSARQNMTGGSSYKFYVDAVRVYDPIDPSSITGGTAVYEAYAADNELNASYQCVRDLLASSFGETGGNGTAGVVLLETGDTTCTAAEYQNIGPKNEVYLNPGQAIAFNLTTSSATAPAKVSVGLRMATGSGEGQATVYGNGSKVLTVNGATELYQDISAVMAENWTDAGGVKTTNSPIIIRNTGSGVLSITNLKWSYAASVPAAGRMLSFSFAPQDLTTASAVLRQATPEPETVTPDTPAAQQLPQFDNGRRMLTLQALLEQIFSRFFEALRTAFFKK